MNKTVLITGSSSGIGQGCAYYFKRQGYVVIGVDIKPDSSSCDFFFKNDVSQSKTFIKISQILLNKKIQLSVLINNAAIQVEKTLIETEESEWDQILSVNLKSIFLSCKYLHSTFTKPAAIINIASIHGRATSKGLAAYVASKGAICSLTRAMAIELAEKKIRVNSILPGAIETNMLNKGLNRNHSPSKAKKKLIESSPLKAIGTVDDIAKLCFFLSNEDLSSNITGQEFVCDGGVLSKLASE